MTGTLHRTIIGWIVRYDVSLERYGFNKELPIHPEDANQLVLGMDKMEIEFKIVNESWDGYMGGTYAKLINRKSEPNQTVEDDVKTTTSDKIDGIIFQLPFDDKIKLWELIDKLVEENRTEISDEEIVSLANEHILYNDSKRQWVIEGMKLYREQLKTK